MNSKTSAILNKAEQDRNRGDFIKALRRVTDGITKLPDHYELYEEGIGIAVEAGESREAVYLFKSAHRRFADDRYRLWRTSKERLKQFNDAVFGNFLLEQAIKIRELETAVEVLDSLKDHAVGELLKRNRTKRQTLNNASGFAAGAEVAAYTLAEALLCLRLSRFAEAIDAFMNYLDVKPADHEVLEPLFIKFEKTLPKQSGMAFALGCGYLTAKKYVKALPKIVEGVRASAVFAEVAITKLEGFRGRPDMPSEDLALTLVELHLINQDLSNAVAGIRAVLDDHPVKAPFILDLIGSHLDLPRENLDLDYLYIEAAMLGSRHHEALIHINNVYKNPRSRADLMAWLADQSHQRGLPLEILNLYGKLALQEQMFEKAVEVFRQVLSLAPLDAPAVREAISHHRRDPKITAFYAELSKFGNDPVDDVGVEHTAVPQAERPKPVHEPVETPVESPAARPAEQQRSSDADDFGIEIDQGVFGRIKQKKEQPIETDLTELADEPVFEASPQKALHEVDLSDESSETTEPKTGAPLVGVNESIITLGSDNDESVEDLAEEMEAGDDNVDFDTQYDRYLRGELDHYKILELIETSLAMGQLDKMKKLLEYQPATVGEEIKRKFYLAEYYVATDYPLAALVVLKTVKLDNLSKTERIDFMIKIAGCYQRLNRYDAAHGVYLRILSEDPGFAHAEQMAKINYQKYLSELSNEAPVLEKVSTV